ncbi:MAG TPA: PIG-L family deacetylase [Bryobacteraceae bacterium]|nr:PIG-L family deacetylase [Bryobacteraceae bacterium]
MFLFSPVFLSAAAAILFTARPATAQPNLAGEEELHERLAQLATTGSVMMIGAHPDDENTALLAYFSRGRHMRTAYLSLTRGEGGQNLLGSEQGDELGIIRTQELLAARRIDGGEQFFTRAIDFGFTKTADETFAHWPREKVLADIVWDIRRFRPDVIVLRFSGTPRDGHGQHQVSAILGREAFSAAADRTRFPEQFALGVEPWQAKRLMYNVLAFTADQTKEARAMADRLEIDVGQYNPELGYSYAEIAGMSRSQHRSQGMGAPQPKGVDNTFLVTIAGDVAKKDVFDGIDTTWRRFPGGDRIQTAIEKRDFAIAQPLIAAITDPLAKIKLNEIHEAWALDAGLWLDAVTDKPVAAPGGNWKVNVTALVRSPVHVLLSGIKLTGIDASPDVAPAVLVDNQSSKYTVTFPIPGATPYSQPYWLVEPKDGWLYTVPNARQIGDPENPPVLEAHFELKIAGAPLSLTRPVRFRYIDHIYGEKTRPIAIVPPVAVDVNSQPLIFPAPESRSIDVPVKSNTGKTEGDVSIEAPTDWRVDPPSQHFNLTAAGQQTTARFTITPPSADSQAELRAVATVGERKIALSTETIDYPHIPMQTLFPPAAANLVRADIKTLAHSVGYIMGAGDQEPDAIRQMGATVTLLSAADLATGDLSHFDAIVTGVRAFNVRPDLRANVDRLFDYVRAGGALVVQYNTLEGGPFGGDPSLLEHIGPLPITVSRDRVTEEDSKVSFPHPENPLLHAPNPITDRDFDGWVQERGLDFASDWDPKYQTVLESHDRGEDPHPGGELYLRDGNGAYIFSAYSWFRELPAGVPGAFRLFANMLSAARAENR